MHIFVALSVHSCRCTARKDRRTDAVLTYPSACVAVVVDVCACTLLHYCERYEVTTILGDRPEGPGKETSFCAPFMYKNDHFTKTGSGQT